MAPSLAQLGRARHVPGAAAAALFLLLQAQPFAAAAEPCSPADARPARAVAVDDLGGLRLASGELVRLADVVLPQGAWREASVDALRRLAGRGGLLGATSGRPDRHGRLEARIFASADGETLAAALVARGLAFARPPDRGPCGAHLLRLEAAARDARRGLWAEASFRPLEAADPGPILERRGEFVLVEGTVLSVGERPRRTYLNFGAFWNQDFTAYMDTDAAVRIAPEGLSPGDLQGRRVRIRGYVLEERGPAVAVTQPGQLELVDRR